MSCSARKSSSPGLLPAIDRYDGPPFQVLRKQLPTRQKSVQIVIISAKFGVIDSQTPIPTYECRLNATRAAQLRTNTQKAITEIIAHNSFDTVFIFGGKLYLSLITEAIKILPKKANVQTATGRPGERLRQLKEWLITFREFQT